MRVLRYVKGTVANGLTFKPVSSFSLQCFVDTDWASSVDDRKSTGGFCVFLGSNLLTWSSRKQSVVARSSTEAEYRALATAATDLVWLKSVFQELGLYIKTPSVVWCDNMGAIALASNPVFHSRTKHIEVDIHFIREKVHQQLLEIRHISSEDQLADVFTKPLSSQRFHVLCSKFSLSIPPGFTLADVS